MSFEGENERDCKKVHGLSGLSGSFSLSGPANLSKAEIRKVIKVIN